MTDRSGTRDVVLAALAFAAVLALLLGLTGLVDQIGSTGSIASTGASSPSGTGQVATTATPAPAGSPTASPSSATPSLAPAGSPAVEAVLVGAGDIADCDLPDDEATAALLDDIAGTVFTAGDAAYPTGSLDQFRDCYDPTWGRHLARTHPAPGNHEWETADLGGYVGYFGDRASPDGTSWYAYDLGSWHVVVLDSTCARNGGCGPDSAQGRWLAADLAANDARCTIAIWHHPRWSSGQHGDDPSVIPFWQALYDAGADVVVNGHDHDYERFAPQDPDGREDRARGIREFVVGTGGAALRDFGRVAANSELRASVAHGVLRLDLRATSYDWRFIPTAGDFGDAGTAHCH